LHDERRARAPVAPEIIAKRLIANADRGERDATKMSEGARDFSRAKAKPIHH